MFNLPTQTKRSGPVASPFEEKVTCWQGDSTEPLVPPKAQRLVLTGMDTFQAWACRASVSSGIGSRLSGPRTQTLLSSTLDTGTALQGRGCSGHGHGTHAPSQLHTMSTTPVERGVACSRHSSGASLGRTPLRDGAGPSRVQWTLHQWPRRCRVSHVYNYGVGTKKWK